LRFTGLPQAFRFFFEDIGEVMRNHGCTGSRRHHDVLGTTKYVQKVARHLTGFLAIAAIESRLATTSLGLGEVNLKAQTLQDFGYRDSNFGK